MSSGHPSPTPKYKALLEPHVGQENLIYKNLQAHPKIPNQIFSPVKTSRIKTMSVDS